jgi:CDP-diacylglycerol---glycerol-3-phosphate 3-phosphatidyltransferase
MREERTVKSEEVFSQKLGRRAPNILTFLRMLMVPVFVFLLINPTKQMHLWATGVFIIASLTDWLDGFLARRYRAETRLGTLMDPIADKILVMAALVMLAALPTEPRIPAWIVVVLLSREMFVNGLRSLAAARGTIVPASRWAKHKTAWTMIAIVFLLVRETYSVFGVAVNFHFIGFALLLVGLFFSLTTGYTYARDLKSHWS